MSVAAPFRRTLGEIAEEAGDIILIVIGIVIFWALFAIGGKLWSGLQGLFSGLSELNLGAIAGGAAGQAQQQLAGQQPGTEYGGYYVTPGGTIAPDIRGTGGAIIYGEVKTYPPYQYQEPPPSQRQFYQPQPIYLPVRSGIVQGQPGVRLPLITPTAPYSFYSVWLPPTVAQQAAAYQLYGTTITPPPVPGQPPPVITWKKTLAMQ